MGTNYDGLVVKYGALDATATVLGNQAKKLEEDLRSIKTAMASVAAGWEGEAHQAYVEQQELWDKEAADIQQALQGIGKVVGQAGGDYMGGDKKAASYFH
ncbi:MULTISPECIES: WXG100 family type VII secretion target [unclassified Streptomyces]|uniref:WXG100 family type VII secretion target n=1 Tax=unclassified Streptomyces TaxID=2593676 RepID=UPI0028C4905B|nr:MULTISPECIES: WXG100 family type VII secretion target [unclassified Streptomyces]WNO71943.1 WXG100 family type VII secretion target [Streptomyces sp. AM8-1-1]